MSAAVWKDELAIFPPGNLKAVVIYDDFDLAVEAIRMLQNAASQAGDAAWRASWSVEPWRANLLPLTGTGEAALEDSLDAHLVLVASREPALLGKSLLNWLRAWVTRRRIPEAALAVWAGHGGDSPPAGIQEFSQFAERQGVGFVFYKEASTETAPGPSRSEFHRGPAAPVLSKPRTTERPVNFYREHWGINE